MSFSAILFSLKTILFHSRIIEYHHQSHSYLEGRDITAIKTSRETTTYKSRVEASISRGLNYQEAAVYKDLKAAGGRLPWGFWRAAQTARNFIYLVLDDIPAFKEARQDNNIATMARLYREVVIAYKPKDSRKYKDGQSAYFYEIGHLVGLMRNDREYLDKQGSPGALLRLALPRLIDPANPDALHPREVEICDWDDPQNAKDHILLALDTIPGFKEARLKHDIKTMADLYRQYVMGYQVKDPKRYKNGQCGFFYEIGALNGLMMSHRRAFLNKTGSPASLLKFALPYLVDANNPDALHPCEIEKLLPDGSVKSSMKTQPVSIFPVSWSSNTSVIATLSEAKGKQSQQVCHSRMFLSGIQPRVSPLFYKEGLGEFY